MSKKSTNEDNIALPDQAFEATGGAVNLAKLGSPLILYFYPKDSTAGCTTQANDFTARLDDFAKLGYQIIGVSRDSMASHQKFTDKQQIGFPLISDPNEMLCRHFDVIREKNMYGKKTLGIHRSTFIFDGNGKLTHAMRNVRAKGHVERVLSELSS